MFRNRVAAGRLLARELTHLRGGDAVVLGLPRGGVPVAFEVAQALDAPLDVIVVRKVGVPWQPELAMGAVGEGGATVVNTSVVRTARIEPHELRAVETAARAELERQVNQLRGGRPRVPLEGRTAIIVDDGVATGSTARAACQVARAQGAGRVVLAVPVAAPGAVATLSGVADEVVCVQQPEGFFAVGQYYEDFTPTSDHEVITLLDRAATDHDRDAGTATPDDDPPGVDEEVMVSTGDAELPGHLTVPPDARGVVVFVHGSGSSRHSPRNRHVADMLHRAGLGTLLFDLLTREEEVDRRNVFDIGLLAGRLRDAITWLREQPAAAGAPVGLFGASTGAAAALWTAAEPDADIAAVVSRGGRPDLAGPRLDQVRAPTLLIVGGHDEAVLALNRSAEGQLGGPKYLAVVPGATHLFEEPGTLQTAAELAADWFTDHFPGPASG
jgi:putative phosphoribosyl transferase